MDIFCKVCLSTHSSGGNSTIDSLISHQDVMSRVRVHRDHCLLLLPSFLSRLWVVDPLIWAVMNGVHSIPRTQQRVMKRTDKSNTSYRLHFFCFILLEKNKMLVLKYLCIRVIQLHRFMFNLISYMLN